jgi:hypothetical protein
MTANNKNVKTPSKKTSTKYTHSRRLLAERIESAIKQSSSLVERVIDGQLSPRETAEEITYIEELLADLEYDIVKKADDEADDWFG